MGTTTPVTTGTVWGSVHKSGTTDPIKGAKVTSDCPSQTVITDQEGKFTLSQLTPGDCTISASADGYKGESHTVKIIANEKSSVVFKLIETTKAEAGDSDADGVLDAVDLCPQTPAKGSNNGCPACTDTTKSIVKDLGGCSVVDRTKFVIVYGSCCSDQDDDKIIDTEDKCPKEKGVPPDGCPKEEEKVTKAKILKLLDDALGDGKLSEDEKGAILSALNTWLGYPEAERQ